MKSDIRRRRIISALQTGFGGGGGSHVPGDGLIKELYQQSGNSGTDIRISLRPISDSQGDWSANVAYSANEIRTFPTGSELYWISNQSTAEGESPYTNPEKWDIAMGVDFVQDIGGGKWSRVTLQRNIDSWVRLNSFEIGTYATASWFDTETNYTANVVISQTSATTNSVPTTHPSSRTFTIATGLATIPNSSTVGASSSNFAIPTARSQFLSVTLSSGLGLEPGDYVTMYGDASNFFVYGIVTYDDTTGEAYGWCINFVGSGTFSSWTVKSELLLFAFQTGAETSRNFQMLVQSYDSGTGALTGNSITHVGSGSTSSWTIIRSKVNNSFPATQQENFNRNGAPLETVGCWFTGEFTGSGLTLTAQKNTTGAAWRVFYVDGPDIDNPPDPVDVDLYNGSQILSANNIIWTELTEVLRGSVNPHKFIAVSILSPNGSSTNTRAFIKGSTDLSLVLAVNSTIQFDQFTTDFDVSLNGSQSLGETVFIFAPTSADDVKTWPFHGDQTDNPISKEFFIDGVEVQGVNDSTLNPYLRRYIPFTTARVEQTGTIVHPDFPGLGNFASYESTHEFDRYGFHLSKLLITLLRDQFVGQLYVNLFAFLDTFTDGADILSENTETMAWPVSGVENMTSTFKGQSNYLFYSVNAAANRDDYVLGLNFPDVSNWRIGEAGRGTDHIENLVGISSKFRPYVVFEHDLTNGWSINIKSRIYLGNKGTL